MKNVKNVIVALSIFTIAGGILAFKAQEYNGVLFCTTEFNELDPTNCPEIIINYGITGIEFINISSCTDVPGTPCVPADTYPCES
jgi:hypothetical protein